MLAGHKQIADEPPSSLRQRRVAYLCGVLCVGNVRNCRISCLVAGHMAACRCLVSQGPGVRSMSNWTSTSSRSLSAPRNAE